MGKRYYCDYCDKTMANSSTIIKTHNKGILHQQMVQTHYQLFKDPETVLYEESLKSPCTRFFRGACQFGSICRYSHYSREEINMLQCIVNAKKNKNNEFTQPSFEDLYQQLQKEKSNDKNANSNNTVIYDSNGITYVLPWTYNPDMERFGENLPPSLKKMKIDDFKDAQITSWG